MTPPKKRKNDPVLSKAMGRALMLCCLLGQCSHVQAADRPQREPNLLLIQPGSGPESLRIESTLTLGDAKAIKRSGKPAVVAVAPVIKARTKVAYGKKEWPPLYIYGITLEFLRVREWKLDQGRAWTEKEGKKRAEVCLLGQTVARQLFGDTSPVDKTIRINGRTLKVIGTLTRKGENLFGLDQDDIVLAPWTTVKHNVNRTGSAPKPSRSPRVDMILVGIRSEKEMPATMQEIKQLLRKRHQIRRGRPDDFTIRNLTELAKVLGR